MHYIFLYKQKKTINEDCLTIMDGPFFTLYKWNRSFYNLYSVKKILDSKKNTNHQINQKII